MRNAFAFDQHPIYRRLKIALATMLAASSAAAAAASPTALQPDALLQVDLNRSAVIEKIVASWGKEIPAAQLESFKSKLAGLRADHLLAANLSGSFDGVLEVLSARETHPRLLLNTFNSAPQVLEGALTSDVAKALGDGAIDLVYTPITPCNLMDTRPGVVPAPPIGAPALVAGYAIRNIQVTGNCGIPAGAQAVSAQFTIENIPSAGGVVFAGKTGGTASSAVVSWSVPANYGSGASAIPISASGQMQLQSAGATQIKVDVNGYFLPVTRGNITNSVSGGNVFHVTNTSTTGGSTALRGQSTSTGTGGIGVYGSHAGGGFGVYGTAGADGYGVYASAPIGAGAAVYANGDLKVNTQGALSFGSQTRQMINLWGSTDQYGIGVQAGTQYFRTDSTVSAGGTGGFAWFEGGTHSDTDFDAGAGGTVMMQLTRGPSLIFPNTSPTEQQIRFRGTTGQGLGGQNSVAYMRTNSLIAFFQGGNHAVGTGNPDAGGGNILATIQNGAGSATVTGNVRALSFTPTSDRASKSAFSSVNAKAILAKVAALPISTWMYNAEKESGVRHIGPVAQDFKKAFNVGYDDKSISLIDASGVALTAIKGLSEVVKEKDARINKLERELAAIKRKLGM